VLPMISGVEDIRRAKRLIMDELNLLRQSEIAAGDPRIGAMIEVPSAVLTIGDILNEIEFICLGTNDLVQYLLAVDRDNESVADFYQTLHPAVTRSIRSVIRAAETAGIAAIICGEMAGSSFYTPLLIGLGAREFSMNLNSIHAVRIAIEGISFDESAELARQVESAVTAAEAEALIRRYYAEKWPHLSPPIFADQEVGIHSLPLEN
jgi:phosphoenolpyruvate-protein phosphotransferase (PTS system enzyme I)